MSVIFYFCFSRSENREKRGHTYSDGETAPENLQAGATCGQVSRWEGKYQVHHRWGCSKNSFIQIYTFNNRLLVCLGTKGYGVKSTYYNIILEKLSTFTFLRLRTFINPLDP